MRDIPFLNELFGLRKNGKPNIADGNSKTSVAISQHIFEQFRIRWEAAYVGQAAGSFLERSIHALLHANLSDLAPDRPWEITHGGLVTNFRQYAHLARVQELIEADASGTLAVEIGSDYQVRPDVTVGLRLPDDDAPLLHAAVSCKLTLRSDRAQNVRHEAVILNRHRRGRQPHIVAVTAEPLPTRIASLARGTGELDSVYHVALDELVAATSEVGTTEQKSVLDELISQHRLFDLEQMPNVLTV